MRALAKNPANRYQSAGEFRDDLMRVIAGQEVEATPLLPAGAGATQVISRPPPTAMMPPTQPDEGRKTWMWVLIGALILLILGGGAYLLAQSLLGDEPASVTVPNVVGLPFEQASARLTALNLEVAEPVEEVPVDPDVEPGTVLEQAPLADALVEEGATVTLTIAKAPRTFPVPDLTGMTLEEAQITLEDANLTLGDQATEASDVPEGEIIRQEPAADEEVPKDTPVNVVVSSGPEITTVSVPDVTCLSFGQAKAQLVSKGLQINEDGTRPPNPLCSNPNKIAAQDPPAGSQVQTGSTVNVYTGETSPPTPEPS
jgi:eukaryotic-like serine/threonine-protein kinase